MTIIAVQIKNMDIKGFKKVSYNELQKALRTRNEEMGMPDVNIAATINVKSVATVRNSFNMDEQVTSDEVLTKVFDVLKLSAFVLWMNGERNYYISTKN